MKTLLIHGYGTKVKLSVFRDKLLTDGGFTIFRDELQTGSVKLFSWGVDQEFSLKQLLNPKNHITMYQQERSLAESKSTIKKLLRTLEKFDPECILTHSMGAYLVCNALKEGKSNKSLKKIVFTQADISDEYLRKVDIIHTLKLEKIQIENYHCFWDQALLSSQVLNKYKPIGLYASKINGVNNHFFPLYKTLNLHESIINDPVFKEKLAN